MASSLHHTEGQGGVMQRRWRRAVPAAASQDDDYTAGAIGRTMTSRL